MNEPSNTPTTIPFPDDLDVDDDGYPSDEKVEQVTALDAFRRQSMLVRRPASQPRRMK